MPQTHSELALQLFQAMGLSARSMPGNRCVLVSMRLGEAPFLGAAGPQRFKQVLFSTVGSDQIKCLRPRALFQLPIISIRGCTEATAIEARIRQAWRTRTAEIALVRRWLESGGTSASPIDGGSVLAFSLEGEDARTRATMIDQHRVMLPSRGALSGRCLDSPEERVLKLSPDTSFGLSLNIAVSTRLDELSNKAQRADEARRHEALVLAPEIADLGPDTELPHHILLVGPRLAAEHTCIASLRLRGYNVGTAASQQEALIRFNRVSPQLVVSDVNLGRTDGFELILALRALTGIEDMPVILVDDYSRPARRAAAKRVGAVGYIVYPFDVSKIDKHVARIITSPPHRRFTRYSSKLRVQVADSQDSLFASALGRGGMYLSTQYLPELNAVDSYRLALPDLGETLVVNAQVVYTESVADLRGVGAGMRFRDFPGNHEELLIQYLQSLEKASGEAV